MTKLGGAGAEDRERRRLQVRFRFAYSGVRLTLKLRAQESLLKFLIANATKLRLKVKIAQYLIRLTSVQA